MNKNNAQNFTIWCSLEPEPICRIRIYLDEGINDDLSVISNSSGRYCISMSSGRPSTVLNAINRILQEKIHAGVYDIKTSGRVGILGVGILECIELANDYIVELDRCDSERWIDILISCKNSIEHSEVFDELLQLSDVTSRSYDIIFDCQG